MAKIVEVTNPVTGQPAQVDQLDHTAQEIDDGIARALPGGYYDKWVSQLVNPNLLDNWYFWNPIDQRQGHIVNPNTTYYSDNKLTTSAGTTSAYVTAYRYATGTASGVSYASFKLEDTDTAPTYYAAPENVVRGYTGAGYGPDRWLMWGNSNVCLITESGIVTLDTTGQTPWLSQKFPVNFLHPGVYTISALFVSKIKSDSPRINFYCDGIGDLASITDTDDSLIVGTFTIPESAKDKQMWVSFDCRNCDGLKAVKLELGSQQTLAHQENGVWVLNEIPDFGEQLARCQRHQFNANPKRYGRPSIGVSTSQSSGAFVLSLPVTMRAIPTVTFRNLQVFYLGQNYNVTSINVSGMTDNAVLLDITFDATIPNGAALILVANEGSELLLTANL